MELHHTRRLQIELLGGEEVTMSLRAPVVYAEEKMVDMESPFLNDNPAPLERDPDDIGSGPLFPETPEQALMVALDDDESFDE